MAFVPLAIVIAVGLALWLRPWPLFLGQDEPRAEEEQVSGRNVALDFGKWVERQARARGLNVRGFARSVPIECPKCHKASNYFVYPDEVCERCWKASLRPVQTPVKGDHL